MNHSLTGNPSLLRNLDVGEILRLREQLAASDAELAAYREVAPALLDFAEASCLRLPGWDETMGKARKLINK